MILMKKMMTFFKQFLGWSIFLVFTPFFAIAFLSLLIVAIILFLLAIPIYWWFIKLTKKDFIGNIDFFNLDD